MFPKCFRYCRPDYFVCIVYLFVYIFRLDLEIKLVKAYPSEFSVRGKHKFSPHRLLSLSLCPRPVPTRVA